MLMLIGKPKSVFVRVCPSLAHPTALSVFQPIAPALAACYNPRNDCDGDDVGRSQLTESRRSVRGGSRARAQSPPESPGTLSKNKEQNTKNKNGSCRYLFSVLCSLFCSTVQPTPGAPVTLQIQREGKLMYLSFTFER